MSAAFQWRIALTSPVERPFQKDCHVRDLCSDNGRRTAKRPVLRRRARYRFPEFEVEPRLGGPHAAGVGAVISFGRAAPSPAFQREQMPEYLRRA